MWSWFVSAVLGPLFNAIRGWFSDQQNRADEQSLGQKTQAVADERQQVVDAESDEKRVADVVQAENSSLARSAADPGGLRDPDPDSRD